MSAGAVEYLEIGTRVRWISEKTGLWSTTLGTILPDPETSLAYPVDPEGFERPKMRWVEWDDDTNGPDLMSVDELTVDF